MVWKPAPARLLLGENAVHLWRINLDQASQSSAGFHRLLSAQEAGQAGKFHFERDRRRFGVSHGTLRVILGRYLDCAPQQVAFGTTAKGKPFLVQPAGLRFNLAHSHELALVAITSVGEIGVDVEHLRPLEDIDRLARQCFARQEYEQFNALSFPQNQQAFFNCWTRKEAYIKALGDGLSYPLDQFVVSLLPAEPARLVMVSEGPAEAQQWTLQAIELGEEYAAAFALRARNVVVQYWDWTRIAE
jgi:4'-phosphopantetheinyl transferase